MQPEGRLFMQGSIGAELRMPDAVYGGGEEDQMVMHGGGGVGGGMLVGATTAAMAIAGLCGCAAALPDMAGLAQPGNLVTGLMAVRSTAELNRANEQLARAQA